VSYWLSGFFIGWVAGIVLANFITYLRGRRPKGNRWLDY